MAVGKYLGWYIGALICVGATGAAAYRMVDSSAEPSGAQGAIGADANTQSNDATAPDAGRATIAPPHALPALEVTPRSSASTSNPEASDAAVVLPPIEVTMEADTTASAPATAGAPVALPPSDASGKTDAPAAHPAKKPSHTTVAALPPLRAAPAPPHAPYAASRQQAAGYEPPSPQYGGGFAAPAPPANAYTGYTPAPSGAYYPYAGYYPLRARFWYRFALPRNPYYPN